ncbi:MAG: helix-turn-helix transcriptional regulator [Lachnospiraceae bacterium]|nr:helix-turn-helix transcriptional regulator [Lachnospiraceae bacterium]
MESAIAQNVRSIIEEKGLKQCSVAEKAGYSKQTFNAMLTGRKRVTDIDVMKIMLALEVNANELFKVEKQEVRGRG